jgi:hypothetical protein
MTAMEAAKERWWEAEISRVAGEVALKWSERYGAKAEHIPSLRSLLHANNRPNRWNSAPP